MKNTEKNASDESSNIDFSDVGSNTVAFLIDATQERERQRAKKMENDKYLIAYKQQLKEKGVM